MKSEIETTADFNFIRYSQCWEDTDIVLEGMRVKPGDKCLSIAAAGDNAFSILSKSPEKVVAIDLNESQLFLVELKSASIRCLDYQQMLRFLGYRAELRNGERLESFKLVEKHLSDKARKYWDSNLETVRLGLASSGKFERYFMLFRTRVLPLIHSNKTVDELLKPKSHQERKIFYDTKWNTISWRLMFRLFFSKAVMGAFGRSPELFKYASGDLSSNLMHLTKHALVEMDPATNPYLHWILKGEYDSELPHWLRPKNFELIKQNIDRLELRKCSLEEFLSVCKTSSFDSFNLSDIFEYMSEESFVSLLGEIERVGKSNSRLVYFNMMVPRSCEQQVSPTLIVRGEEASRLFGENKTFFYSRFLIEEVA